MLKEAEEAGHLNAMRHPALAPSLGDAVGTAGTCEYGMSGISTASTLPELITVLWLCTRTPFLRRHT